MGDASTSEHPDPSLVDPRIMDPAGELMAHADLPPEQLDGAVAVLEALGRWHRAERRMSEASRQYMKLGETDMRAIRFALASQRAGELVTPRLLAGHLGISMPSVTKLLDRLARDGHIRRAPHPQDRRSTTVEVTEETQRAARASVGRSHAQRLRVAAQLSPAERDAVIRFLDALSGTESMQG